MKFLLLLLAVQSTAWAYTLSPPPEPGSAQDQEDFAILKNYQTTRSEEDCERADAETKLEFKSLFGPHTGVLTDAEVKKVYVQASKMIGVTYAVTKKFKNLYQRPRPYKANRSIRPCITLPGGNQAYPSSHATVGIVLADFLVKQFPSKRAAILAQGQQIGLNRVIGGVHHPSDVAAGQDLGKQIVLESR
jgi:acid phosphatase (class A)